MMEPTTNNNIHDNPGVKPNPKRKPMKSLSRIAVALFLPMLGVAAAQEAAAQSQRALDARAKEAIEHWTPERRAAAIPRDLVIDENGLGYLRARNGALTPYGHNVSA